MNNKKHVLSALFWKFGERCCVQGSALVISILLARMLSAAEYGTLGIILVFVNISGIITQGGLSTALIQKKDTDETDFSSAVFASCLLSLLLYGLIFLCAPFVAVLYSNPLITKYLRVIAIVIFPQTFNAIQVARLTKTLQFKKMFLGNFCSVILAGGISVCMAYDGYGVWALIAQHLSLAVLQCLIVGLQTKWIPKIAFSVPKLKRLISFGIPIMTSSILDAFFSEMRSLIMSAKFSPVQLGYYTQAKQYPHAISTNLNSTISGVMLPVMSAEQTDIQYIKNLTRRAIKTSTYLVFPMLIGFAAVAESFVQVFLVEQWMPIVPFIQIICLVFMCEPFITIHSQARNALGHAQLHLKIVVAIKAFDLVILVLSAAIFNSAYAIVIGQLMTSIFSMLLSGMPSTKLISYTFAEQVRDVIPNFIISITMGGIVLLLQRLVFPHFIVMLIQIAVGMLVYVLLSLITKNESLHYLLGMLKR